MSIYKNITDEQISVVHKLIGFLRLLHVIGEIEFSIEKTGTYYSMSFRCYDPDKNKKGLIHMMKEIEELRKFLDDSAVPR